MIYWNQCGRLPEEGKYVLVCGHATQRQHKVGIGRWYMHSGKRILWEIDGQTAESFPPTHWMPLPKPHSSQSPIRGDEHD